MAPVTRGTCQNWEMLQTQNLDETADYILFVHKLGAWADQLAASQ